MHRPGEMLDKAYMVLPGYCPENLAEYSQQGEG